MKIALSMLLMALVTSLQTTPPADWKDPSSHVTRLISVAPDVRLEVLDWGGSGRPLVLLAGGGDTAHVYDDFAPKLTREFHVYGITRRGFGASSFAPVTAFADTFGDDVLAVVEALKLERPILAGHSLAGQELSSVGTRYPNRVAGLVYIGAVAPDVGETVQQQLDKYPSDIFSRVEVADGRAWMLPNGTEFFAGDLSEEEQKLVWATHYAPVADLFHQQKIKSTPWKSKPSWYILTTQDHTVHPDLQRWVSKRMGATVVEVESSAGWC